MKYKLVYEIQYHLVVYNIDASGAMILVTVVIEYPTIMVIKHWWRSGKRIFGNGGKGVISNGGDKIDFTFLLLLQCCYLLHVWHNINMKALYSYWHQYQTNILLYRQTDIL